jgi:hypothetical protein
MEELRDIYGGEAAQLIETMADFLLIPLSDQVERALQNATGRDGERGEFVRRLQAHTKRGILTVSHVDLERMLMHLLSCKAEHVPE